MIMVEQIVPVRAISQKEIHLLDVMVNLDWIKLEFYVIKHEMENITNTVN